MEAEHLRNVLPLRYSSHRQIVAANGGLACEVFSGSIGIDGADELQELIVRAVNAHDYLVAALSEMVNERPPLGIDRAAYQNALSALAKAGAA